MPWHLNGRSVAVAFKQRYHLTLRELPAMGRCTEAPASPVFACFAFKSAHRLRCASPMRLRAAADIFREPARAGVGFVPTALWSV